MRFGIAVLAAAAAWAAPLKVQVTWGHQGAPAANYYVRPSGAAVHGITGIQLEAGDTARNGVLQGRAGAGDVDGVEFTIDTPLGPERVLEKLHIIWADLIAAADGDTARRLGNDAAFHPDSPRVTIQMNAEGTRGFTVTADQLLTERALWIPSLDVFVTAGDHPPSFAEHMRSLEQWKGRRILDRVHREPEATYAQYAAEWEDMGSPSYTNPHQMGPGHIVCLTWDSAIPKFGIDRGAGVWNDYGNPDHFQFWFDFGDIAKGITRTWRGQHLQDGLPVITTDFQDGGVRYRVEQFAYPLEGPPSERRGDITMVLLEKVTATNMTGAPLTLPLTMAHRRKTAITGERSDGKLLFRDASGQALLSIEGGDGLPVWSPTKDYQKELQRVNATMWLDLPPHASKSIVVKLPSPAADPAKLAALDYNAARQGTLRFWSAYVDRGAHFDVPEKAVNDLFRASLWHALRLPRRHGGTKPDAIDLPYSNFAYSQTGTPWPVNQSVYVDYMLYDLRGYHAISTEEVAAQYQNNQEQDGHLKGVANWLVYTPGMLYAVAQDYFLSGDNAAFERLLPQSLRAMDWCVREIERASSRQGAAAGLVEGPLNDGTGKGYWAFNQAYLYQSLRIFARALAATGHPRAAECNAAAERLHGAIDREFHAASMRSPLVELRDHTWIPYVPGEVLTPRRLLEDWYPADVDTGPLHLIRLEAIPANGDLADSLLNDHEDNLFYKGRGIANEPVYNQQATAYLLRDDPDAVVRAFYSYMASAFSHSVFEPVEHRWTHGQYFGPPSTDGAWFELYRNMLLRETSAGELLLAQATPRAWLEDGKKIVVERAPTWFGPLTMTIASRAASGTISAEVSMPSRARPKALLVRLRHPDHRPMRAVTVNGRNWSAFDPAKEWVRIENPAEKSYAIVARY